MKKRGQITIFVILGIVLIILVGLLLYVKSSIENVQVDSVENSWQDALTPSRISDYVDNCLNKVGKEAFVKLGAGGGYINPAEFGFFTVPNIPTSSSALEVFPGSDLMVPYWYYLKSSNTCTDCIFDMNIPSLEGESVFSIQSQVNKYIVDNIDGCINNFELFKQENLVIDKIGSTVANVEFSDGFVFLQLEYPISINSNAQTIKVKNFNSKLDFDFKKLYELAINILEQTELNYNSKIFEKFTRNIIDYYSIGDSMIIPPIEGPTKIGFSSPKVWISFDVAKNLERFLSENIQYNQIVGSKDFFTYISQDEPREDLLYNSMFNIVLSDVNYDDLGTVKVDFNYLPWWPLYLKISPGGGVIMPESSFNTFLIPIGIQKYKFSYDVSYPVLVNLYDSNAFDKNGYNFQYAFEVNLRNSDAMFKDQVNVSLPVVPSESSFANYNQRNSGNITIKTINSNTGMPLSDVMVSFDCVDDSLMFGVSKMVSGEAVVTGKLPICLGGFISGLKADYYVKAVSLSTAVNKSSELVLEMEPVVTLNLKAKIRPVVKELGGSILIPIYYWSFKDNLSNYFDNDETLVLIFKRQSPGEDNFVTVKVINNTNSNNQTIDLVSGDYFVQGLLFMNLGENYTRKNITIPEKHITYDTNGWLPGGEETVTIDEMIFNSSFFVGGLLLDNSTSGFFKITKDDLINNNEITVFISSFSDVNQLNDIDDLQILGNFMNYSTTHKEALTPKFE